ncbi:MAG: hypothetical protein IPO30_11445 [Hyphomonadaceae bacterium]|nr:hypothetical protein [Hyphomonadaceae bacterium]
MSKSLQEKWRRVAKSLRRARAVVDADGLLETLKETRSTGGDFALIASLTAVRAPKGWEEADAPAQGGRAALARYLDDNADADPLLDLVIFDEAHHLRNPETAQHKSARQLVAIADYKLMLSATPINLHAARISARFCVCWSPTFSIANGSLTSCSRRMRPS